MKQNGFGERLEDELQRLTSCIWWVYGHPVGGTMLELLGRTSVEDVLTGTLIPAVQ